MNFFVPSSPILRSVEEASCLPSDAYVVVELLVPSAEVDQSLQINVGLQAFFVIQNQLISLELLLCADNHPNQHREKHHSREHQQKRESEILRPFLYISKVPSNELESMPKTERVAFFLDFRRFIARNV